MSSDREPDRSALFLVRLWASKTEELAGESVGEGSERRIKRDGDEDGRWHGRLLHVISGEGHNFDGWHELVDVLREMLSSADQQLPGGRKPD